MLSSDFQNQCTSDGLSDRMLGFPIAQRMICPASPIPRASSLIVVLFFTRATRRAE